MKHKNEMPLKIFKQCSKILFFIILLGTVLISSGKAYAANSQYETEDNDTIEAANEINFGSSICGDMKTKDDVDYYKLNVTGTGVTDITLAHASLDQEFSLDITVYQYENGNYTEVTGGSIWVSEKYHLTLGTSPGTYYIVISAGAIASANGKYVMGIDFEERSDWEKEFNDSTETANGIKIGSSAYGTMKTKDDNDYYKFTLSQPALVQVGLAHTDINQAFDFCSSVYRYKDGSYTEIASGSTWSTEQKYLSPELKLSPGTYYIKVSAGAIASKDGKYKLDLNYKVAQTSIINTNSIQKTKIKINYKKVTYISGYEIYRKSGINGKYVRIKTISNNKTISYIDNNVKKGNVYYYKVRTYYKDGNKIYYSKFSDNKKITVNK